MITTILVLILLVLIVAVFPGAISGVLGGVLLLIGVGWAIKAEAYWLFWVIGGLAVVGGIFVAIDASKKSAKATAHKAKRDQLLQKLQRDDPALAGEIRAAYEEQTSADRDLKVARLNAEAKPKDPTRQTEYAEALRRSNQARLVAEDYDRRHLHKSYG